MTVESFLTSIVSEQRWVDVSMRTFQSDLNVDISPCIFQVPKSLGQTNRQAYTPQKIGLGPYHHFRPEFFTTERHKLSVAKSLIDENQVQHFAEEVLDKLLLVEPDIRGYYDNYLDLEGKTLVWILAIDSFYLLHLLESYDQNQERQKLAQDLVMLENQIPSYMLIETRKAINQPCDNLFPKLFYNFCKAHSPLRITEQDYFCSFNSPHLLAHMYQLIINNRENVQQQEEVGEGGGGLMPMNMVMPMNVVFEYIVPIVVTATSLGLPGGQMLAKPVSFMKNLPWDHIKGLVKKDDENKPIVEETEIPSVIELNKIAKINFKLMEGGIRDIKFVEEEEGERVFYLPEITLDSDSDVILRNLVAYEAAVGGQDGTLEFAEYVDLMCGIVDTPKDVDLLKNSGIIKGSLSDEEIVDLFNGISKSTGKSKMKKSDLEMAIETVNKKFDNVFRVKAQRFLKKHIYTSWKFLSVLLTIVLIMLLSLQAFCQVYGCSNRWFHTPN